MSIPIHTGKVVMAVPTLGAYILTSDETTQSSQNTVIAYAPVNGMQEMYVAGTTVVFVYLSNTQTSIGYILGSINYLLDGRRTNFSQFKFYNAEKFTQSSHTDANADIKLMHLELEKKFDWMKNHAHSTAGDALAGDLDLVDNDERSGLHIGRLVSQLRGSAMSFVDVTVPDNKVRIVGNTISTNTMTHEGLVGDTYSVFNTAISVSEGFGLKEGGIVEEDDFSLTPKNDGAIPLYRIQHAEGAPVDGKQDLILDFPRTDAHTEYSEPAILSARRQSLSGTISDASVRGIMSVKTPSVAGIHQMGYGTESLVGDNGLHDDLHEPYKVTGRKDIEDMDKEADNAANKEEEAITDAAINKLVDKLLFGEYRTTMLSILERHGFAISKEESSIRARMVGDDSIHGATNSQHYPIPESEEITDPVTGETSKVYNTMSFITQEPDGSICICDGYGSEIRMSRGNIYISPALDLFFRPGRDMSAMVSRHMSLNSQKSCTINSSDAMYVRAEKDMKLAGATSGDGAVTLESRAAAGSNGGLNIVSTADMSITAKSDLVIGRNSMDSKDSSRFTEPPSPGRIIIDAGAKRGTCYVRGAQTTVEGQNTTICAVSQGSNRSGSAISINQNTIGLYGQTINAPAVLYVLPTEEMMRVSVLSEDGKSEDVQLNTMSTGYLYVSGNANIGGIMTVKDGIRVDGAGAIRSIMSETLSGPASVADRDPYTVEDALAKTRKVKTASATLGEQGTSGVAESKVHTDAFVADNSFSFPDDYNVQCDYMPGMVWQMYARETGKAGKAWEELPVKALADDKDTMCYPGAAIWDKNMSVRGYSNSEVKINGGYPTNTLAQE